MNRRTTLIGAPLALLLFAFQAIGDEAKEDTGMTTTDQLFIGFPHKGPVADRESYDRRDEDAATKYYEGLFLGKDIAFVREVCDEEKKKEEDGLIDAQTISCQLPAPGVGKGVVSYRFPLEISKSEPIVAALVWDVDLLFEDERITDVAATAGVLAP